MDLSQPLQHRAATALPLPQSSIPKRASFRSLISSSFLFLATLSLILPTVSAQDSTTQSLSISFLDESGEALGQAQNIPRGECKALDTTSGAYTTAKSSDPHSALNLYSGMFCSVPLGSTTGEWANTGVVKDVAYIRWEGTAPSTATPGDIRPTTWPENMAVQTKVADSDDKWVMDPSKGVVVVAVVAGVMVIGVLIGVYQVYKAAQYVPPPKKPKKPTGLNTKKIKKKDAYFKKPVRDDQQSFQRLHNESPEPFASTHQPMMTDRSRDSQYSEAATTFVDWSNNNQNSRFNKGGRGGPYNSDSVSIDMRETSRSSPSPLHFQSGSSTLDLINFDHDSSNHRQGSYNNHSDRGRGGEVLVPMHTFDNNYQNQHGRLTTRRASSSRSR
ncbi:hypothetical protein BGX28_001808 [Mortierella sp. GBA30]|nr:hypothetical protein BGX28_001808 [Mortierella sp. GBA30]